MPISFMWYHEVPEGGDARMIFGWFAVIAEFFANLFSAEKLDW